MIAYLQSEHVQHGHRVLVVECRYCGHLHEHRAGYETKQPIHEGLYVPPCDNSKRYMVKERGR